MVEGNGFIFRTDLKIVDPLNISFSGGCNFSFPSKPLLPGECRPAGRILFVNMMYFVNVKFRDRKHIGTFAQQLNDPSYQIHPRSEERRVGKESILRLELDDCHNRETRSLRTSEEV